MRTKALAVSLLLTLLTSAACQTARARPGRAVELAITNVTVIDPERRAVLPGHSVFIDNGRIVAVAAPGEPSGMEAARRVDGSGRFLIPGLIDMHVHLFLPEPATHTLNLMLANGVTGIREMSGDCWEVAGATEGCIQDYRAIQARIDAGEVAGPDLLELSGPMVWGPASAQLPEGVDPFVVPSTEEDARRLARYLKQRGVELIKTHASIPNAVFVAMADEAAKLKVKVAGHVPAGLDVTQVARHGYASIEHARDVLYDCSRYGPEFRRASADFNNRQPGAKQPDEATRLRRSVEEFEPALCEDVLGTLARTSTYYVPTHGTREMEARAAEPSYRNDARRKYILRSRDAQWEEDLAQTASAPRELAELRGRFFRHGIALTGLAHRAGVKILVGTDTNDTMIFPGFSVHRELSLLAEAGLSPMDILRAATTRPALYLGRSDALGGISAGKEADLVLLRENPLVDIRNSTSIEAVVADGKLYDAASLKALLDEAARVGAKVP